jgi:hypothetical protein
MSDEDRSDSGETTQVRYLGPNIAIGLSLCYVFGGCVQVLLPSWKEPLIALTNFCGGISGFLMATAYRSQKTRYFKQLNGSRSKYEKVAIISVLGINVWQMQIYPDVYFFENPPMIAFFCGIAYAARAIKFKETRKDQELWAKFGRASTCDQPVTKTEEVFSCPNCSMENAMTASRCNNKNCEYDFSPWACPKCKNQNRFDNMVCSSCSFKLE